MEKIIVSNIKIRIALVFLSALSIFIIGSFLGTQITSDNEIDKAINADEALIREGMLSLATPSFSTTFLDEEAGISLYTDVGQAIDLSTAKTVYKTVEKETSDYIIGSISLPNLLESDDVHCYVHKDGWIVVYYLKAEPTSKIIDWNSYIGGTLTKTKLELGLEKMYLVLGVTVTIKTYYNFQYPFAQKCLIIIDKQEGGGTDSFNLKLPGEFIFYEKSWSHRASEEPTYYGLFIGTHLSPDIYHTIEAYVYNGGYPYYPKISYLKVDGEIINEIDDFLTSEVGIVLIYREP